MNRLLKRANSRISFGNAATLLFVVTLAGQLLGFLRTRLVSANWKGDELGSTDAFFAAFQIPDLFFYTIAAGALGVAFMPILAERLQAGDRKNLWAITSSLLNLLAVAMVVVALILIVFAKPLVHALYPNLSPENLNEAVVMLRLISFNPLFFTLAGIMWSAQQTFGRFFFYAIGPLIYNLSIIVSIYLFKDNIGIIGLAYGALFGGLLQLVVAWLGMAGLSFKYTPKINFKNEDFRHILRQLPPRSLDQGIDQVNSVVELNRADALSKVGSISNYSYALTLMNVPIMLLGSSIATAAFPRLNDRLAQGRPDLFRRDFLRILRIMVWLLMPVCVVAYFARGYLARLIYGDLAPEVALIFGFLVVAIFFRSVYAMVSRYFYSNKDTVTPLLVSILAIGLNIYLAFTLAKQSSYGITGLALAQSIVAFTEVAILFIIMVIRDPKLIDRYFWGGIVKIVSVTGFSLIAAFVMISLLPLTAQDRGFVTLVTKLGLISGVTILTHIVVSWIFGLEEVRPIIDKTKRIVLSTVKVQ
jgi:putative peptidoglycan lipid II flippase